MLRCFPVVTVGTARLCVGDVILGDAPIAADDMILAPPAMMNFDEATFREPREVDFERRIASVGTFGQGPHKCIAAAVARTQLAIFVEEWLARIPEFSVSRDGPPVFEPGVTLSYDRLMLEWPVDG